jgi:glycopeptide antibiotics resistance protein
VIIIENGRINDWTYRQNRRDDSHVYYHPLFWLNTLANVNFFLYFVFNFSLINRKSFKANPRILSYSKAFSGGLFLSVGLIHLLPEVKI